MQHCERGRILRRAEFVFRIGGGPLQHPDVVRAIHGNSADLAHNPIIR